MGFFATLAKRLLMILNGIFFLVACVILGLGIYLLVAGDSVQWLIGKIPNSENFHMDEILNSTSYMQYGGYILTGCGSSIFLVALCGICGVIGDGRLPLYIYSGLLVVVLLVELAAAVLWKFYGAVAVVFVHQWLSVLISDHYEGAKYSGGVLQLSNSISDAVDFLQVYMSCCGVTNYTDFDSATRWHHSYNLTTSNGTVVLGDALVPISCCKITNPEKFPLSLNEIIFYDVNACVRTASPDSTNLNNCYRTILAIMAGYSTYVIIAAASLMGLEAFAILLACVALRQRVQ